MKLQSWGRQFLACVGGCFLRDRAPGFVCVSREARIVLLRGDGVRGGGISA